MTHAGDRIMRSSRIVFGCWFTALFGIGRTTLAGVATEVAVGPPPYASGITPGAGWQRVVRGTQHHRAVWLLGALILLATGATFRPHGRFGTDLYRERETP